MKMGKTHWKNHFRSCLIAALCGIEYSGPDRAWQVWIDSLSYNDALQVYGCLIQKFGWQRNINQEVYKDPRENAQVALAKLEKELSDWFCRPKEVIDYVLAAHHAGLHLRGNIWYWLPEHQDLSKHRTGNTVKAAPQGVRLLPLTGNSLECLVSERLNPSLVSFFKELTNQTDAAGNLIDFIESGCNFFDRPVNDLLLDPSSTLAFEELKRFMVQKSISTQKKLIKNEPKPCKKENFSTGGYTARMYVPPFDYYNDWNALK